MSLYKLHMNDIEINDMYIYYMNLYVQLITPKIMMTLILKKSSFVLGAKRTISSTTISPSATSFMRITYRCYFQKSFREPRSTPSKSTIETFFFGVRGRLSILPSIPEVFFYSYVALLWYKQERFNS